MNNPLSRDQVLDFVRQVVADTLDADSLDFVDIVHRLEKGLDIALPKKTLLEHAAEHLSSRDPILNQQGLTPLGAALLRHGFNEFSDVQAVVGMGLNDLVNGATVRNWASLCYRLFDYLPETCPSCGGSEATLADGVKVVCGRCGSRLRPQSGDSSVRDALPGLLATAQQDQRRVRVA